MTLNDHEPPCQSKLALLNGNPTILNPYLVITCFITPVDVMLQYIRGVFSEFFAIFDCSTHFNSEL